MNKDIIELAQTVLGVPYIWGGASRAGMDCSGLIEWLTNQLYPGKFPGRQTAAAWWNLLPVTLKAELGDLCFWSHKGKVYHVALVEAVDGHLVKTIGAHGGNSKTTTAAIAKAKGACVKRAAFPSAVLCGYRTWPWSVHSTPDAPKLPSPPPHSNEPPEDWV